MHERSYRHLLHMLWGVTVAYAECELGGQIKLGKMIEEHR